MEPTMKTVNKALADIEAAERDPQHPLALARQAVKRWRSDAEKHRHPVTNVHDDKGARVLDVAATLAHNHHDRRLGRK